MYRFMELGAAAFEPSHAVDHVVVFTQRLLNFDVTYYTVSEALTAGQAAWVFALLNRPERDDPGRDIDVECWIDVSLLSEWNALRCTLRPVPGKPYVYGCGSDWALFTHRD